MQISEALIYDWSWLLRLDFLGIRCHLNIGMVCSCYGRVSVFIMLVLLVPISVTRILKIFHRYVGKVPYKFKSCSVSILLRGKYSTSHPKTPILSQETFSSNFYLEKYRHMLAGLICHLYCWITCLSTEICGRVLHFQTSPFMVKRNYVVKFDLDTPLSLLELLIIETHVPSLWSCFAGNIFQPCYRANGMMMPWVLLIPLIYLFLKNLRLGYTEDAHHEWCHTLLIWMLSWLLHQGYSLQKFVLSNIHLEHSYKLLLPRDWDTWTSVL